MNATPEKDQASAHGLKRRIGQIASATASGYAAMGVAMVTQVAALALMSARLSPQEFGLAVMINAAATYSYVGALWLWTGSIVTMAERHATGDAAGYRVALGVARVLNAGYASLFALLGIAAVYAGGLAESVNPGLLVSTVTGGAVYLVLLYAGGAERCAMIARGDQVHANIVGILASVVTLGMLAWLLHIGLGLAAVPWAHAAGAAAGLLYGGFYAARRSFGWTILPLWSSASTDDFRALVSRGGMLVQLQGALGLTLGADVLIVGAILGPEAAGVFVALWKAPEILLMGIGRIGEAAMPHLVHLATRRETASFQRLYLWSLLLVSGAGAAAGAVYGLFGPDVVSAILGPSQRPEAWACWLAGAALFFLCAARLPVAAAIATRRFGTLAAIMAAELAVKLAVIVSLAGTLGEAAPVAGILLAHGLGLALAYQWLGWQIGRRAPA